MINPPVTVQGTNFTVSPTATGIHKPSLPLVTPRILEKIRKGKYIDFSTLTTHVWCTRAYITNLIHP